MLNYKLNSSRLRNRNIIINLCVLFSFILISIFSVFIIWHNDKVYFTGDSAFHLARLEELLDSKVTFPRFALNSFDSVGSIVMTMYPYMFLYLMALIFDVFKSIKITLYITFIIGTFLTLIISFYSTLKLKNSKLISYIFALIYSLSYEFINMYFSANVIGVYWSAIFMPLVIFGFIYYLKYNKWVMLSIGMSLILFSSVITFLFLILILFIWLMINYKLINLSKLKNLLKAGLLSMLTTSIIWLPLLKVMKTNKLRILNNTDIQTIGLLHIIYYSIIPKVTAPAQSLTIYSFFGLIIGAVLFKKLTYFMKQSYLFSIFIILFCTPIFPWYIFKGNFIAFRMIRNIQMTCRMLVFPQVILEFILSVCLVYILKKYKNIIRNVAVVCISIIILLMQCSGQCISFHSRGVNKLVSNRVLSDDNLATIDPGYHFDYFPKSLNRKDIRDLQHHFITNGYNNIHFKFYGNGHVSFNIKRHINKLRLPFIYYNSVKYKDLLNSKLIKSHPDNDQLMTINNINKGHKDLHIIIPLSKLDIIARSLTIISIPIYGLLFLIDIKNIDYKK